jgi:hypothetical protein
VFSIRVNIEIGRLDFLKEIELGKLEQQYINAKVYSQLMNLANLTHL